MPSFQVVAVARTFVEVWEGVANLLSELDVLAAFADLSTSDPSKPFVRPEILEADGGGEVVLVDCRHPCLEAQEGVEFVPNTCRLVPGESLFTIVTGPNMGGKSTFIRQVRGAGWEGGWVQVAGGSRLGRGGDAGWGRVRRAGVGRGQVGA